ncbi:ribosome assembly factor SBDS [Candidatus Pacearchaeota archaeon]|nr:ribosome assembly factor SBDS [Candidatus Pacearchaeota archaeon]
MATVEARIKVKGKTFEISVDLDEALKVRAGTGNVMAALNSPAIYTDATRGMIASKAELEQTFDTTDVYVIAEQIMKKGEIQKNQEFRDAEREKRIKQVIDLILRNAVDQHGRPYTAERIRKAIHEVHFNFDNRPAEQQMHELIPKLATIIPIKVETKKIKLKIPARFSGQVYGFLKDYKESEEWLANGDLQVIMNIPSGLQIDFYDKLNSVTHGAVISEEMK